jgi:hypothetical protein
MLDAQVIDATFQIQNDDLIIDGIESKESYLISDLKINQEKDTGFRVIIPVQKTNNKILSSKIFGQVDLAYNISLRTYRKNNFIYIDFHKPKQGPVEFKLNIELGQLKELSERVFASKSVLASGDWHKMAATKTGVHVIKGSDLINYGLTLEMLNPQTFKLFSNGAGQLPFDNCATRIDDLKEIPYSSIGLDDNKFDPMDEIRFFIKAQDRIEFDSLSGNLKFNKNYFEDTVFFFINTDGGLRKQINEQNAVASFDSRTNEYQDLIHFEQDIKNLIRSGREWYGDEFDLLTTRSYKLNLPNYKLNSPFKVNGSFAIRSISSPSSFNININGTTNSSITANSVGTEYFNNYAESAIYSKVISNQSTTQSIDISFNKANQNSIGWLDYLSIEYTGTLSPTNNQLIFRNTNALNQGIMQYEISNLINEQVWDISKIFDPLILNVSSSGEFRMDTDSLHEFILFNENQLLSPKYIKNVDNQNLHAYNPTDFIIITPKYLENEALRLAEYRRNNDDLTAQVVTLEQIYNEYSGGGVDITAIKDFLKMFYDRAVSEQEIPKYVLLFADGSYDNKGITIDNKKYIPTYQSKNSLYPLRSYTTDDYIGLLDDDEGEALSDLVDIGIGRLPINSIGEANQIIDKIIRYYHKSAYKDWRMSVSLVGDDGQKGEGIRHMDHANQVGDIISNTYPKMNIEKLYLDAFEQVESAGGQRYPEVNTRLNKRMKKGALFMHYAGHGGELGWSHERVLQIQDIRSWTNTYNMPIMVTATCEFSRFDDHNRTAAGELVLMNPSGGAAGLFTTTRLVTGNANAALANAFYSSLDLENDDSELRLGDFARQAKIAQAGSINTRNFSLLGDPSLKLAYPRLDITTIEVPDTLRSLDKITITASITKDGVLLNDFNGIAYINVFDKESELTTLNNDGEGYFTFEVQDQVIFKGKSTVENGVFSASFIVPKDIRLDFGLGKISYYAVNNDGNVDAAGFEEIVIGGVNPNADFDKVGPQLELYLNDEDFVDGGYTDANPIFYANLFDESGLNTASSSIGHDMTLIMDDDTDNMIFLNDDYEAELDNYKAGKVSYQLNDLEDGVHRLTFKAWDTYNNSNEESLSFIVADNSKVVIDHILNYPNPFTTNTAFYFDHNQAGRTLDVSIDIMTVSGKLVRSIKQSGYQKGNHYGPITWNGRDEFEDRIGRGVYVYRISVTNDAGETVSEFEKLVLLN